MDGTGREQDLGEPIAGDSRVQNVPDTLRKPEGEGDNLDLDGAPGQHEGQQAVRNQSIVEPDDYAKSSESGV